MEVFKACPIYILKRCISKEFSKNALFRYKENDTFPNGYFQSILYAF